MREPPKLTYTRQFLERSNPQLIYRFQSRIGSVLRYYPEVKGEIMIGLTTTYRGLASTESDGVHMQKKLCFPSLTRSGLPTRFIIGHELMHIVQAKKSRSMPGTERSCDIYTLARLPPRFIDHLPVYLKTPWKVRLHWSNERVRNMASDIMHDLAIEAVIFRKENPKYISWWENQFNEVVNNGHPISRYIDRL